MRNHRLIFATHHIFALFKTNNLFNKKDSGSDSGKKVKQFGRHNLLKKKNSIMNTLRNKVQLIGNLGNDPEIITLDSGKKLAKILFGHK